MNAQNCEKAVRGRPFQAGEDSRRNLGGRPKADPAVRDILLEGGAAAAQYLVALVQDQTAKPGERLRAAEYILDRLLGKAVLPIMTEVHQEEDPVSLSEMMERVRELYEENWG